MNILFYGPETSSIAAMLQSVVEAETTMPGKSIRVEASRSISDLTHRLLHRRRELALGVILAENEEELSRLVSIKDLFFDLRIILILPDNEAGTIAKGHSLRPRFLAYMDRDPSPVGAVVRKMLKGVGG